MGEEHLYVAAQVIHALCCNRGSLLRFRQYERALEDTLRVERQTGSGPRRMNVVFLDRFGNVGLERLSVTADAEVAGFANRGKRVVCLLHHGAHQASEFGQFAVQQRFAEINVGQDALERIGGFVIRSGCEEAAGLLVPARCGCQRQVFFAAEVMKKAAFGETSRGTDVIDARRGVPAGADQMNGSIEQPVA